MSVWASQSTWDISTPVVAPSLLQNLDFTALATANWLTTPPTTLGGVTVTPAIAGWTALGITNGTGLVAATNAGVTGTLTLDFLLNDLALAALGRSLYGYERVAIEVQLKAGQAWATNNASIYLALYEPPSNYGAYLFTGRRLGGGATLGIEYQLSRSAGTLSNTWAVAIPRCIGATELDVGRFQYFNDASAALPATYPLDTISSTAGDISGSINDGLDSGQIAGATWPSPTNKTAIVRLAVSHGTAGADTMTVEKMRVWRL